MATNFGIANNYNLFILNDINMQNTDVEGRLAVGGNATLQNYGIGASILPLPPFGTDATFVMGGATLSASAGTNSAGNTVVSPSTTVPTYTMGMPNGSLVVGSPIDFVSAKTYLECLSTTWGEITPSGTANVQFGGLTLTGASNTFNIFEIDANNVAGSGLSLSSLNQINIVAPIESTILINVVGSNIAFGNYQIFRNGISATRDDARYIVWNFPNALTWTNNTTGIFGSVLAPFASATTASSQINGNVIFKNLTGTGEVHNELFIGDIPVGICDEPTTSSTTSTTSSTTSSTSSTTSSTSSTTSSTSSTTSSTSSTTSSTSSTTSSTSSTTSTTSSTTSSTSSTTSSTSSTTSSTSSTTSSTSSTTTTQNPCSIIQSAIDVVESIALEETGLANLINAESCKILKAIDLSDSVDDLVTINSSVEDTLELIVNSQMLLNIKLKNVVDLIKIALEKCNLRG